MIPSILFFFSKSIISVHFSPALVAKVNTELDTEHNHWKLTDDYKWWCADISLETESNPRNSMYRLLTKDYTYCCSGELPIL